MHPILGSTRRLVPYLAAWLPLAGLLAGMLVVSGRLDWPEAAALAAPLTLVYALLCLGVAYPCRALPLKPATAVRAVVTHLASAMATAAAWTVGSWELGRLLERVLGRPGLGERVATQAGLVFAVGVLIYLLAVTAHYLLAAASASAEAERRALAAEVARREAELAILKAQLNPHFLFNALNTIAALAAGEAARGACLELAELLRGVLRLGTVRHHSLAEELTLVRRFLAIERLRFSERLTVEEVVEPGCLAAPVPPLLLQPLAENAVKHGVARRLQGGAVRIEASCAGGRLRLAVSNPVDSDAPRASGTGVGLQTARKRVEAEGGLLRSAVEGGIFRVEVELPWSEHKP